MKAPVFDYLDLNGFKLRTVMPQGDVQTLETVAPGWLLQAIRSWSSRLNAQLRKRYGNAPGIGNSLPLGQLPPSLEAQGTLPPALTLYGRPVLGSMIVLVTCTLAGALGTATLSWSADNGVTKAPITSAASVALPGTGLTLIAPAGAVFALDNAWAASPPVPETVLQWLTILVTWDAYQKRGRNPQDPLMADMKEDRTRVLAEIAQAADSKDGLFDLPASEDVDSAITTGEPLGYAEQSPYAWTHIQARQVERFGGGFR